MEENNKDTHRDLYSYLPKKERKEAQENLSRYAELVWKIYSRLSEKEKQKLLLRIEWEKRNKGVSQNN